VVKVHGWMRARQGTLRQLRVLQVHADYLFVYPVLDPTASPQAASLTRIVLRVVVNVDFPQLADSGGTGQAWWGYVGGGPAGAQCGTNDGFIHPAFPSVGPGKVTPSGAPVDPYNQAIPPDTKAGCQATTGT
jgi:hypothetical protein